MSEVPWTTTPKSSAGFGIRYADDTQLQFTNARGYPGVGGMQVAMEYLWIRVTTPRLGAQRWKRCNERSFLYAQAVASIADTAYEAMKALAVEGVE